MWGRRKSKQIDQAGDAATTGDASADQVDQAEIADTGPRSAGPWDSSERDPETKGYVNLGSLRILGREGVGLQLPVEKGVLNSIVVIVDGSAMELRVFADSRSGGQWAAVLDDLAKEVERRQGVHERVQGPFGEELIMRVGVKTSDGKTGVQQSRIIGVAGPRWILRATLLGQAALTEEAAEKLMIVLRDVIVVRGDEPRMLREPLPLQMPPGATVQQQGGQQQTATRGPQPTQTPPAAAGQQNQTAADS